ncbi:MAG TPA: type II secretion system protein [Candidatus Paceibacterota bacterium]|nr:type II secretion system protein [Candidatus Paceibacterota bacterium]HMP19145.1 type II secretion system protein [Candidatus Paceibacterota bacterium]
MKNLNKGFTLIELLVVIAIISILSTVILSSIQDARLKAQSAKTVQQVREVQNAIAMFVTDNNKFPSPGLSGIICLGPQGATCHNGVGVGLAVPQIYQMGDFANINFENNYVDNSFFAKVALAQQKVNNYINFNFIDIPVFVRNSQQYGGGIIYQCIDNCNDAVVTWSTPKPVTKGTRISNDNVYVYKQIANDPGGGAGGAYGN